MVISRQPNLHVVYLDKQPYALCHDRSEALRVTAGLLKDHHAKRIALLHA
ncbi:hypothetical protein [Synechococcus sp. RSCCF101]|nr:hypothetical protein [Synechococcus sp. RSCCF101]